MTANLANDVRVDHRDILNACTVPKSDGHDLIIHAGLWLLVQVSLNCLGSSFICCLSILLAFSSCTGSCMIDFWKWGYTHSVMKADLRISIKDYHRKKHLKILLFRPPFPRPAVPGADERGAVACHGPARVLDAAGDGLAQVPGEGRPCWRELTRNRLTGLLERVGRVLARFLSDPSGWGKAHG